MRTMNITGFALLCATIFTGCSKGEETVTDGLAIRLNAGMQNTVTRSAVNSGDKFTAQVAGWEVAAGGTKDYGTTSTWSTTAEITASETTGNIALAEGQFYNPTETIRTYLKAWYPQGEPVGGVVNFTSDGMVDVMLASEVVGSAIDNKIKSLNFKHKLTQLKFELLGDETFANSNITVKSITVLDARLPNGFDLTKDEVKYTDAAALLIPGISTPQALTTQKTRVGNSVMIAPFVGNTFKADVVTNNGSIDTTYSGITVTIDNDANFVEGRAYTICLIFNAPGISVSATVTPWTTGTGSGTVN